MLHESTPVTDAPASFDVGATLMSSQAPVNDLDRPYHDARLIGNAIARRSSGGAARAVSGRGARLTPTSRATVSS